MGGLRNRHLFISDIVLLPTMVFASFILRLEAAQLADYFGCAAFLAVLTILLAPPIFMAARLYSRYWPYASVDELLLLLAAVVGLAGALTASFAVTSRLIALPSPPLPRSIPLIFLLLAIPATAGPRLAMRFAAIRRGPTRGIDARERVLVIGAGAAGTMIVRELRENPQLGLEVVGFLDDDPAKRRMRIRGVVVLGARHELAAIARGVAASRVIIALPQAPGRVIREIVHNCEQVGIRAQTIPGLYKLIDGTVNIQQLRDVEIEDLLRREPIRTDLSAVAQLLGGKRVLITGAGGSIGGELARQALRCRPQSLILLGHGENSIFAIASELAQRQAGEEGTALIPIIADVRAAQRLRAIFEEYRPEIVFHAAAHKHVPLMEANPAEAVTNNILGTRNVIDAALGTGVERFVMISTDKAVNPANVMGASKRVAELLVHQAAQASGKPYMVLRFGNVLGSRGSVVPTMKRQIARGGPVTVTHPEIMRFFITIPEAVQLVLQAGVLGRGGEVFVLDMGEPIRILDMARDLIALSGLEVGADIDIVFTGLRPGEKLYEELFLPGEEYRRTEHGKIFVAANAGQLIPAILQEAVGALDRAAQRDDSGAIRAELRRLLPNFVSPPPAAGAEVPESPAPASLGIVGVEAPAQEATAAD